MTTLDLFTEIGTTEKNISEIQSNFFPVVKVLMIPNIENVMVSLARTEATIAAVAYCKEQIYEDDTDGLAEALDYQNAFNDAYDNFFENQKNKAINSCIKKAISQAIEYCEAQNYDDCENWVEELDYQNVFHTTYNSLFKNEMKIIEFQKPVDMYGVYNAKNGKLLSQKSMGKDFLPMQQQEFLDNILATIHEFGADLDLDTLTFKVWDGGAKIEFSVKMYPISFKNDKGLQDITNMIMTFSTSYDGSKSNRIAIFTERLVCLNGMTALKLSGELKGRNTQGGKTKILSYAEEVAEIFNSAEDFRNKMMALDKIKVTRKQVEAFKKSLLGYNRASLLASDKKSITRNMNILESLETAIELEFQRTGKTAFGLLQGATYYTNHLANTNKKISDAEYIRFHQGAKTNDKAQELVFALLEY